MADVSTRAVVVAVKASAPTKDMRVESKRGGRVRHKLSVGGKLWCKLRLVLDEIVW